MFQSGRLKRQTARIGRLLYLTAGWKRGGAMTTANLVAILLVLLLLTIVSQPLSRWVRLPYSSTLVIVGFAVSELAVAFGIDTGIRAGSFHDLIFFVFLPILVFEAAFCIDVALLRKNLLPILFLATVIMLSVDRGVAHRGVAGGHGPDRGDGSTEITRRAETAVDTRRGRKPVQ